MNLSPEWVVFLHQAGKQAEHWSTIGNPSAPDSEIFQWASEHGYIVLTCDLGFGSRLANSRLQGPSVVQFRVEDVSPDALGNQLIEALNDHVSDLEEGAIITIDENGPRVRNLPII